jgi:hypothetical protein
MENSTNRLSLCWVRVIDKDRDPNSQSEVPNSQKKSKLLGLICMESHCDEREQHPRLCQRHLHLDHYDRYSLWTACIVSWFPNEPERSSLIDFPLIHPPDFPRTLLRPKNTSPTHSPCPPPRSARKMHSARSSSRIITTRR